MMLTIVSKVMLMMTADDVNDNEMMMTMMLVMLVSKVVATRAGREGKEILSRTGPTVGNDDEGEIERRGRGDYQTSEGVEERVDCES